MSGVPHPSCEACTDDTDLRAELARVSEENRALRGALETARRFWLENEKLRSALERHETFVKAFDAWKGQRFLVPGEKWDALLDSRRALEGGPDE